MQEGCSDFARHVADVAFIFFLASSKSSVKAASSSHYLKLSLPVFLAWLYFLPIFSFVFLIDMFLVKQTCSSNKQ